MTQASTLLLALFAVMALLDWVAVARETSVLEYVAKPAATLALLAVTATLDVPHGAPWGWLLTALAFCVLGDVFLMLPRDAFVPGLASFAVGQVSFAVSFATGETTAGRVAAGVVVALPVALLLSRRFVGAIHRAGHAELVAPVTVYVVVISMMAVGAIAGGSPVVIAGAAAFMVSDSLIAESRFVRARPWHSVGIMVTYHLALVGLVLGFV